MGDDRSSNEEEFSDAVDWIDRLSTNAKTIWFSLLGYLAFVGVTLLSVEDADFFIDSRKTELPLIGIAIPTAEFFLIGPLLGTILYVYLHLYLLKLWDALAEAPATTSGRQLSQKVAPWLVNDFGLWLRFDQSARPHPMAWFSHMTTFLLIFVSGPFVIAAFWIRFWPAHSIWVSLCVACLLMFTLLTMFMSLAVAIERLSLMRRDRFSVWHVFILIPLFLILAIAIPLTVAKTDGRERVQAWPLYRHLPFIDWDAAAWQIASADLREVVFTPIPDGWLPYDVRKADYREQWCKKNAIPADACGAPPFEPPTRPNPSIDAWEEQRLSVARKRHCDSLGLNDDHNLCEVYFSRVEDQFWESWRTTRSLEIETLDAWIGYERDLRGADLSFARLDGADLRGARLEGAVLWGTSMEGVQLGGAHLHGAMFDSVSMQLAQFNSDRLTPEQMHSETFEDTTRRLLSIGSNSSLEGANLYGMEIQVRSLVDLEGAYLPYALITGQRTYLTGARILSGAFRNADLSGPLPDISRTFGDGTVNLPRNVKRPCHWSTEVLDDQEFFGRWRGWKGSTGDIGDVPALIGFEAIEPISSISCK